MTSDQDEIYDLLVALQARIKQCMESDDLSSVLDPAAVIEESRLLELVKMADSNVAFDMVAVEWVMAYLHWFRYQGLPDGPNQDELPLALAGFRALSDHAPQFVLPDLLRILTSGPPPPASDAERLFAQSSEAFEEFRQQGYHALIGLAVALMRDAIAAAPAGDEHLPGYLTTLGSFLSYRFEVTGSTAALDDAIEAGRQAAALITPADRTSFSVGMMNLSNALSVRFERDGDGADLDAAIDAGQRALTATPDDDESRPLVLANLANALSSRFDRDENGADLDAAINALEQALAATPERASQRMAMLANLGVGLRQRFDRDGRREDLDSAIDLQRQAVEAASADYPGQALGLVNLGTDLARRFRLSGDNRDLLAAIDAHKSASQVLTGIPGIRLSAAERWGNVAAYGGLTGEAADGYEAAVRLLPQAAWHGLDRTTRREQLVQWAGLAASAAACAVADGRPRLGRVSKVS